MRGRGTVEDAAWVKTALMPLAAPTPPAEPGARGGTTGRPDRRCAAGTSAADCAHDGRDPRDHGARMWDALVEASRRLAGTEVVPESHGARPWLSITVTLDALLAGLDRLGNGLLDTGETRSAAAVRTIACDAHHIRHWADGGTTALPNLTLICRSHHTLIHTTPWQIRLNLHDQRPEFVPPPRPDDTDPAPLRRRPLRT